MSNICKLCVIHYFGLKVWFTTLIVSGKVYNPKSENPEIINRSS